MELPEPHETKELVVRQPRAGRVSFAIGFLFFSVALLLIVLALIPTARHWVRQNDERQTALLVAQHETECRAKIQQKLDDARAALDAQQAHDFVQVILRNDVSATIISLDSLSGKLVQLANVRGTSFEICHANPRYEIPQEMIP